MATKDRLIAAIQQFNPSATRQWLDDFTPDELREYLDHLEYASRPRPDRSPWPARFTTIDRPAA